MALLDKFLSNGSVPGGRDLVLGCDSGVFVLICMDDVLVFHQPFEGHLEHLRVTLKCSRDSRLNTNPGNAQFTSFYMVHRMVWPSDDKLKTIPKCLLIIMANSSNGFRNPVYLASLY